MTTATKITHIAEMDAYKMGWMVGYFINGKCTKGHTSNGVAYDTQRQLPGVDFFANEKEAKAAAARWLERMN